MGAVYSEKPQQMQGHRIKNSCHNTACINLKAEKDSRQKGFDQLWQAYMEQGVHKAAYHRRSDQNNAQREDRGCHFGQK